MAGGAPLGNKNASKSRLFEQAIIRALKQRDIADGDGETLRKIADKLIDIALSGGIHAFVEMRDTVEGRPAQQLQLQGDADAPLVHKIIREVVDPTKLGE